MSKRAPFTINGQSVAPGARATIDLPISVLSNHTPINLSVHVVHGKKDGPTTFVSAAIHGDEVVGVEIVRRLLNVPLLEKLRGTLLAIPVVNVFGFIGHSRYLPDRRDLNRSFPGSETGSLASRLAHLFLTEVVRRSDFGIDLHSAAIHRNNLPQIRVSKDDADQLEMAKAFGAPIILTSNLRDGSLRHVTSEEGIPVLVYEAGEGLRFDEFAIRTGVAGILRVLKLRGMLISKRIRDAKVEFAVADASFWLRAPQGGVVRMFKTVGEKIGENEIVAIINDPFGESEAELRSHDDGLIIGRTNLPVVNQGDALVHVARLRGAAAAERSVDALSEQLGADPLFDEDEVI